MTFLFVGWFSLAEACRVEEPTAPPPQVLHKHIVGECTVAERSALSLSADELFLALEAGKSLDLSGVVVKGDLFLDRLPSHSIGQHPIRSSRVKGKIQERGLEEVRVILGAITIHKSWFEGVITTNLKNGALMIFGQVDMAQTKFQKSIDFSRTIFLEPVNFSDMKIAYEGFFIAAHFDKEANFSKVAFGTHTRFHKAFFGGTSTFNQAGFHGLAEFLEVVFAAKADFSQTFFKHGTGFSGTQFLGTSDFSQAFFEREAFFRFTNFQKDVSFRGASFQGVADFANVQVRENPDFLNTKFRVAPDLRGSKILIENQKVRELVSPTSQIAIFVGLFLLVLFFIWRLRRENG